jgi:hypothetical protein
VRPARLAIAFVLGLLGLIWLGQGLGFIGGSFMSGDPLWAAIGAVLAGIALGLVVREWRLRPRKG